MTLAGLVALALIDSINPSAIAVTLYLISISPSGVLAKVMIYVGAIFVTYFTLGVTMVLGLDALAPSLGQMLDSRIGLIAQSLVGLALLIYSLTASSGGPSSPVVARPSASTYAALAALGVTVTAMELPTAIPYFAAVALITGADLPVHSWAPLLVLYNVIFVLPPMALLVGHLAFEKRLADRYTALRERLQRGAQGTVLWVAGLVGGALLMTGLIELIARLR